MRFFIRTHYSNFDWVHGLSFNEVEIRCIKTVEDLVKNMTDRELVPNSIACEVYWPKNALRLKFETQEENLQLQHAILY